MARIESLTAEQWRQVNALRDEWLAVGLDTAPADRGAAEATVTEMYRLCGRPAPRYIWLDSPGAHLALWLLPGTRGSQLSGKLWDHLASQLGAEFRNQLQGQLGDQLADQFRSQHQHEFRDLLRSQLLRQLRDRLRCRLWQRLGRQLKIELHRQFWSPLQAGIWEQLHGQPWSQFWGQPLGEFWDQLTARFEGRIQDHLAHELMHQCWLKLEELLGGGYFHLLVGQIEVDWIARYDVPERLGLVIYDTESSRRLRLWADLARSAHWWWPYEQVCVMSDRPAAIHRDAQGRLHCEDGPAVAYRDGKGLLWAWHGNRVPQSLIERQWSLAEILAEPNTEIRRCAIEHLDWDRFVQTTGLRPVATAPDPGNPPHHLVLYDLPQEMAALYEQPPRILLCVNGSEERDGTRRRYGLLVPASHTDPVAAAAELYDLPVEAYLHMEVRR